MIEPWAHITMKNGDVVSFATKEALDNWGGHPEGLFWTQEEIDEAKIKANILINEMLGKKDDI